MRATEVELVTQRLVLRPITVDDAPALAQIYGDAEVARYLKRLDLAGTLAQVERFAREWDERGIGILAVLDATTGELVGRSGVKYWPQFDETEVGWVIRRDLWGRGLATEAGAASLDYGLTTAGLSEVTAIIAVENDASIAVARRLGMTPKRDDHVCGVDVTVFAKRAPDLGDG